MRNVLIIVGAAAMAVAAPAVAQSADAAPYINDSAANDGDALDERGYEGEVAYDGQGPDAPLLDPREVADMAQTMDRLVGAVMDLPIGPIVAAVDPHGRGDYRRGDTVRDMATRDDPDAEARIRGGIRASTAGIGALSTALTQMMPVFRRSMEEMERSMEQALRPFRAD